MRDEKKNEDKKSFIEFENKKKKDEYHHKALWEERKAVVEDISELTKKNVEVKDQGSDNSYQLGLLGFNLISWKQGLYVLLLNISIVLLN